MRPLLVSLALLLLALCRLADSTSIPVLEMLDKIPDLKNKKDAISENLGEYGTLFGMFMFWAKENEPEFKEREKSLDNGVLCLLEDTTIGGTITKQLYTNGVLIAAETEVAKDLFGIDCAVPAAGTPEWDCFCTTKSTIFFCAAHIYKKKHITAAKEKCKKEALAELKLAGTKTLGKYYDYAELAKKKKANQELKAVASEDASAVDKIVAEFPEAAKFFCDAINPDVETKVKALFATDAAFSMVEVPIAEAIFGADGIEAIHYACKNDAEYKANDAFGSCICPDNEDKGVLFCLYKVVGKAFKEAGYLDCAADKLVDAKKPAALPQMKPNPAPTSAPTTAPNGGGNGTATTTAAATGGAATSSLLVAPLAAAAAMLLLRQ